MKKSSDVAKHSANQQTAYLVSVFCILISFFSTLKAENIITSGTTLRVSPGTTLVNVGTLTVKSGGALTNLGTVNISGNLDNQNSGSTDLGTGTFLLNGSSPQNVNGQNTLGNLSVNNSSGVSLYGNTTVNGIFTLTNGRISIGSNNLLLGVSSTIAGTPSSSAMVIATGSGEMRKSFSGTGSFTFPVGDNDGIAEYSPVTLNFTTGTFSNAYAGIKLANAAYSGSTGNYLNRYWNVSSAGISSFTCDAQFNYVPADIVGDESSISCIRIDPYTAFSPANTTLHLLTANGLTSFGVFTGWQVLLTKSLNLTLFLEGLYNGSGTMRKAQNNTGDQFSGNTADQITIELHNSASYPTIVYSLNNTNLSTTGSVSATIPGTFSGSYYVTIKHRNSIETTTLAPLSFSGSSISYNFSNSANQAYGSNMKAVSGGFYAIYAGDANQDASVGVLDMTTVDNKSKIFATGYIPEDIDGNGSVGVLDMTMVDNNSKQFISSKHP